MHTTRTFRPSSRLAHLATAALIVGGLPLLLSTGCVSGSKLRVQAEQIQQQVTDMRPRAYRCAPRELALAEAHATFGLWELSQGNGRRAESHIKFAGDFAEMADLQSRAPACQDVQVVVATEGDRDGDTIPDSQDACPDIPGLPAFEGCPDPDRDKDGVCDPWVADVGLMGKFPCQDVDLCPDVPGELAFKGCQDPDRDSDGVCDPWVAEAGLLGKFACQETDLCPDIPGELRFKGCPNPDTDGDKVCDPWVAEAGLLGNFDCTGIDLCPEEPAPDRADGCPVRLVVVKEDRIELNEQVFFATNKTKVLSQSEPLLDEIAAVLNANPNIHVRIEGHTDSTGSKRHNTKLSQGRANSVMSELVARGIAKGRMTAKGYGPDRPIDTNETPEGRANNRRVEIHITKK